MSEILIHHNGVFNFYNTVSDGPRFVSGLTLEQVRIFTKEEYGNQGLKNLSERIKRAIEKGTSSYDHDSLDETIQLNRAGINEEHLSSEEFIKLFLTII